MKKLLLAPNSFKECSYSTHIADMLEKILEKEVQLNISKFPISDGGDGFLDVCIRNLNLEILTFETIKPYADELFRVKVGYSSIDKILYIESAEVIGLKLIPKNKRHPLLLNTKGLGLLFKSIIESELNVDKVILGIGGTGTSDLGLGCCSVFGLELFDFSDKSLGIYPANYERVNKIKWPYFELPLQIDLITDVDNGLLGPNGASRTFAKQKGATEPEIEILEEGFNKILNLLINKEIIESADELCGAGGGLAAGLQIFLNAKIVTAKEFINGMLMDRINEFAPDYVLTGEGAFDDQSLMDKGAKVVIDHCISRNIPVILLCGRIDKDSTNAYGDKIFPIELQSLFENQQDSINNFEKGLELAGKRIINYIFNG